MTQLDEIVDDVIKKTDYDPIKGNSKTIEYLMRKIVSLTKENKLLRNESNSKGASSKSAPFIDINTRKFIAKLATLFKKWEHAKPTMEKFLGTHKDDVDCYKSAFDYDVVELEKNTNNIGLSAIGNLLQSISNRLLGLLAVESGLCGKKEKTFQKAVDISPNDLLYFITKSHKDKDLVALSKSVEALAKEFPANAPCKREAYNSLRSLSSEIPCLTPFVMEMALDLVPEKNSDSEMMEILRKNLGKDQLCHYLMFDGQKFPVDALTNFYRTLSKKMPHHQSIMALFKKSQLERNPLLAFAYGMGSNDIDKLMDALEACGATDDLKMNVNFWGAPGGSASETPIDEIIAKEIKPVAASAGNRCKLNTFERIMNELDMPLEVMAKGVEERGKMEIPELKDKMRSLASDPTKMLQELLMGSLAYKMRIDPEYVEDDEDHGALIKYHTDFLDSLTENKAELMDMIHTTRKIRNPNEGLEEKIKILLDKIL